MPYFKPFLVADESDSKRFSVRVWTVVRRCTRGSLVIEVGIEDLNLGDAADGEFAAARGAPDRFGRRTVVDAERLLLVRAHIRMNPGDLIAGVAVHDRETGPPAVGVDQNLQSVRKFSFDHISGHSGAPALGVEVFEPLR